MIVETVLESHSVDLRLKHSIDNAQITVMIKDGTVLAEVLPERVSRRTLHYLSRKFNIPIHHFYNPEMAPKDPDLGKDKGEAVQ